jgi:type II secretion system protein N
VIGSIISGIRENLGKIFVFLGAVVVFLVILFPLDDLGDFVASQVAKMTKNSIYVRFDRMGLSIIPQPGLKLKDVYVETATTSPISVQEMTLTPSLGALLYQRPYGHFSAQGFMKGTVDVHIGGGKRTEEGRERLSLDIEAEKISLNDIRDMVGLPLMMRGQLNLNLNEAQVDPVFSVQPEGEVTVQIDRFELPASNLSQLGGLTLPELRLGQIVLNGKLTNGRLNINSGKIGRPGDEIHGDVTGNIGIIFQNNNGVVTPYIGSYAVELNLLMQRSFEDKLPIIQGLLAQYRTQTAEGARYKVKVTAPNTQTPPNMEALR